MISYLDIAFLDSQFLAWSTTVLIQVSHRWDWSSYYSPGRHCVDMKCCASLKGRTGFVVTCLILCLFTGGSTHNTLMFPSYRWTGSDSSHTQSPRFTKWAVISYVTLPFPHTLKSWCLEFYSFLLTRHSAGIGGRRMNLLTLISPVKF